MYSNVCYVPTLVGVAGHGSSITKVIYMIMEIQNYDHDNNNSNNSHLYKNLICLKRFANSMWCETILML
jgi:hypothetical protein